MTKRIKSSELPEFDAAEYLGNEEEVAAYLTVRPGACLCDTNGRSKRKTACWRDEKID